MSFHRYTAPGHVDIESQTSELLVSIDETLYNPACLKLIQLTSRHTYIRPRLSGH